MSQVFSPEVRDSYSEVWNCVSVRTSGEVGEGMDRRQHTRFDLNAPVTYTWKDRKGSLRTGSGTTRDVSECGLFVFTDSLPPAGKIIRFEVTFPFRDDSHIRMRAAGGVMRVENDSNAKARGFAAVTKVLWLGKRGDSKVVENTVKS